MKRFAPLLFFAGCFVPLARAKDGEHVLVGVFAGYLRLSQTDNNFGGVEARVGFQVFKEIKLEGEMSYDFGQTFTEGFTDAGTGSVTFSRTNLRILHGEFGPRINIGHHAIQPFVTLKGASSIFASTAPPPRWALSSAASMACVRMT
jgi:hypothetical protein